MNTSKVYPNAKDQYPTGVIKWFMARDMIYNAVVEEDWASAIQNLKIIL